jgi:hypothetical protein
MPIGDPECPPHVCSAECIYRKTVLVTDGSTGGSDIKNDPAEREEDGVQYSCAVVSVFWLWREIVLKK